MLVSMQISSKKYLQFPVKIKDKIHTCAVSESRLKKFIYFANKDKFLSMSLWDHIIDIIYALTGKPTKRAKLKQLFSDLLDDQHHFIKCDHKLNTLKEHINKFKIFSKIYKLADENSKPTFTINVSTGQNFSYEFFCANRSVFKNSYQCKTNSFVLSAQESLQKELENAFASLSYDDCPLIQSTLRTLFQKPPEPFTAHRPPAMPPIVPMKDEETCLPTPSNAHEPVNQDFLETFPLHGYEHGQKYDPYGLEQLRTDFRNEVEKLNVDALYEQFEKQNKKVEIKNKDSIVNLNSKLMTITGTFFQKYKEKLESIQNQFNEKYVSYKLVDLLIKQQKTKHTINKKEMDSLDIQVQIEKAVKDSGFKNISFLYTMKNDVTKIAKNSCDSYVSFIKENVIDTTENNTRIIKYEPNEATDELLEIIKLDLFVKKKFDKISKMFISISPGGSFFYNLAIQAYSFFGEHIEKLEKIVKALEEHAKNNATA